MTNSTARCMRCLTAVLPISYGLPTEEALDDPDFYSGGCSIILGVTPAYYCPTCKLELQEADVLER